MDNVKTVHALWDYKQAAEFFHIRPDSLRRLVMLGRVPAHRPFGYKGRVLFDPDELRELVRKS